jgi:hypothetical protein
MANLWSLDNAGTLSLNLHAGQARAWQSSKRFIAILAGTQGGKTSFIPWWLWREVQRCGAGDYIAATASYDLFKLKFLPAIREVFEHTMRCGRYWAADRIIELADPEHGFLARRADDPMWGRIILRSAESGGGLESSTAKAAALDEAGMESFSLETWQAVLRRLSLSQGRVLIGTTLYNLGWLKATLYDAWEKAKRQHPEIDIIQFDSIENPAFPRAEYERARTTMQTWKFNMQYRGLYERPAGLIYDSFDPILHVCPRVPIPDAWPRYMGLDFGGINTAAVFYAEEPGTERLWLYREYLHGDRTGAEHAQALLKGEPMIPTCVGGSHSEGQWRREFRAGGLPIREPDIKAVEIGINRVYGAHKAGQIMVFDDCVGYLAQKQDYRRKLDAAGEPTEDIEHKSTYHFMDAERYIIGWKRRPRATGDI